MIFVIYGVMALFVLGLFLWQLSNLIAVYFGSPTVMTKKKVIQYALELAGTRQSDVFYDLGCGNGAVLIEVAKMGVKKAVGYEISPFYFLLAKFRTYKYPNIVVKFGDIKSVDISKVDIIYCYLLPNFLNKLSSKFNRELRKEAKLISISFTIPGLHQIVKTNYLSKTIYIYQKTG